jgi:hypothetical protein
MACSTDESHTLARGTYINNLPSLSKAYVMILLPNCRYCGAEVPYSGSKSLTSEAPRGGTWTSRYLTRPQIEVRDSGGALYRLSGDGQTLTQSNVVYRKGTGYTCDGM